MIESSLYAYTKSLRGIKDDREIIPSLKRFKESNMAELKPLICSRQSTPSFAFKPTHTVNDKY